MNTATLSLCRTPDTTPELPVSAHADFLGRLPVPLRRPFKAGLDKTIARHAAADGARLNCHFLSGAQWHGAFDKLATLPEEELPAMLVTTLHADLLSSPALLEHYAPDEFANGATSGFATDFASLHPACVEAGLPDPRGVFRSFALVPFVFLVDEKRLKGRPAPRAWADLLHPMWADEIVFGGWRPDEQSAWQDYNSYLFFCLQYEFGECGIKALAGNVRHLQHNIRTATRAGSNSREVGAIAILPWLQAELCPRRATTRVVWPEDGALVMPVSYLVKRGEGARVAPLVDYVIGAELGNMLARNCYPPTRQSAGAMQAFPADVRLKWPGWEAAGNLAAEGERAAGVFFAAWYARQGGQFFGGARKCN
jgi:ABC-type Fe3+ transport system substrate-binding protein